MDTSPGSCMLPECSISERERNFRRVQRSNKFSSCVGDRPRKYGTRNVATLLLVLLLPGSLDSSESLPADLIYGRQLSCLCCLRCRLRETREKGRERREKGEKRTDKEPGIRTSNESNYRTFFPFFEGSGGFSLVSKRFFFQGRF